DRTHDDVTVGEHPLEAFVLAADRHRPDVQVAKPACRVCECLVLAHALGSAGHDFTGGGHDELLRLERLLPSTRPRGGPLRRGPCAEYRVNRGPRYRAHGGARPPRITRPKSVCAPRIGEVGPCMASEVKPLFTA